MEIRQKVAKKNFQQHDLSMYELSYNLKQTSNFLNLG